MHACRFRQKLFQRSVLVRNFPFRESHGPSSSPHLYPAGLRALLPPPGAHRAGRCLRHPDMVGWPYDLTARSHRDRPQRLLRQAVHQGYDASGCR
jgi:hypothetical protein